MIFSLPSRGSTTIDRDQLEDAKPEALQRLAKFVGLKVDSNWDHQTLARKLFWEINPIPPARMY